MKNAFLLCFLILAASPAFATSVTPTITVTDPAQVQELAAIGSALDAVSGPITKCMSEEKVGLQVCQCRQKDKLAELKTLMDAALVKHPDWAVPIIDYDVGGGDNSLRSINFDTITKSFNSVTCE